MRYVSPVAHPSGGRAGVGFRTWAPVFLLQMPSLGRGSTFKTKQTAQKPMRRYLMAGKRSARSPRGLLAFRFGWTKGAVVPLLWLLHLGHTPGPSRRLAVPQTLNHFSGDLPLPRYSGIKTRGPGGLAGLENVNPFQTSPPFLGLPSLELRGGMLCQSSKLWSLIPHENKKGFSMLNLEGLTFLPHGI